MKRSATFTQRGLHVPVRNTGPSEPLRMLGEMAEEFGVSVLSLGQLLSRRNGPVPVHGSKTISQKTYYKPSEMRKWWKEVGSL